MLSNYEVLAHIQDVKQKYKEEAVEQGPAATMKPGNLETVMKELVDYLSSTVAASQNPETILKLVHRLAKFPFEKVEVLMIINHQPKSETELDVLIEELDSRLSDDQISEVLEVLQGVSGAKIDSLVAEGL
ncbi:hypothetical protein H072_2554 [Dactylellina haptotyla CBS 200.50]|uniref:DNA-directed RNA polymerase III subunit RPC9 n=1 Tax=Dactylellina haptotyla (strain CBS 200.50) TaxID=1284197 RepID=S8AQV2_DACHA|nr:hypothetical protein H072_2554 [Dactylellina haptotyla CBS 200.50]